MPVSALDQSVIGVPGLALASATRELLRMAGLVEVMLAPAMDLYETADREKDPAVAAALSARSYQRSYRRSSSTSRGSPMPMPIRRIRSAASNSPGFAINFEYVGDLIAKNLFHLAEVRAEKRTLSFSREGWQELCDLHQRVVANLQLALNVLVSKDRESAHQLLEEKDHMRRAERLSYARHLKRLQAGGSDSIDTSDIHLETVRALKSINSLLAGVAYPILSETGDLLDSRLARIAHSN